MHQIYAINADGSGNRKLIDARIGLNHHDWSPDALEFAAVGYVDDATWSIHVFNADGTGLTRLTDAAGVWDSEPAWSPDGTKIAFTRTYPDQNGRNEIWVMDADGSDPRWIGVEGFAAKWSPDGTRFIYVSNRSGNYEIYTAQIDGTDERVSKSPPNKACTGRWGTVRLFKHFSGFEFFLLPSRVHARPSASNTNR